MSQGMTPEEFVKQVYYVQEKVILDFWPSDDKYKEALMEANLVLQELQKEEDWSWLRRRDVLGPCWDKGPVPEFKLAPDVYKVCTLFGDNLRLYAHHNGKLIEHDYIEVPYASQGNLNHRQIQSYSWFTEPNEPNLSLKAIRLGDIVTFNRPLTFFEAGRIAVVDVQRRIPLLHICNDHCTDLEGYAPDYAAGVPCKQIEPVILTDIPDPNYVVIRTAQYHAEGSPTAQGRIASLADQSQKLLSAMRQNDAMTTTADTVDWSVPTFLNVL